MKFDEKPFEGIEDLKPFSYLHIGRVTEVNYDRKSLANESPPATNRLGKVKLRWLDWGGEAWVDVSVLFPSLSTAVVKKGTNPANDISCCYGDFHMPSVDDVVVCGFTIGGFPIVLGYLPKDFDKQTDTSSSKGSYWGTFRLLEPGESSRLSKRQAEIYLDRKGSARVIVREQGADDEVPTKTLAEFTLGKVYSDDYSTEVKTDDSKSIYAQLKVTSDSGLSWTKFQIDEDGNVHVSSVGDIILNEGTKGIARKDDAVKSTSAEDSAFWNFILAFSTWTPVPQDGGLALKTLLTSAGYPSSQTGKITEASDTVKVGD